MKVPKQPKAKAAALGNDLEQLRRELAAAADERADAVRTRHDLEEQRAEVVDEGDLDALEEHDRAIENAKRRIDVADSAHARLTLTLQDAEAEAEQARRRALYAEAETAMAEAQRLLLKEYVPAATALAATLNKIRQLRTVALQANNELPEGAELVSTIAEPEFNGVWLAESKNLTVERSYYINRQTGNRAGPHDCPTLWSERGKWDQVTEEVEVARPSYPHIQHRAVVDFANLPGLERDAYIYGALSWGQPRA